MPGYFSVYIIGENEFLALGWLRKDLIVIDHYETVFKRWKRLATISYDEYLLFKR